MSGNGFFDLHEKLKSPRKAPGQVPNSPDKIISVSQVTRLIDKAIRAGVPTLVNVQGEISNYSANRTTGHAYFTLKDAEACLDCVMFRSDHEQLRFRPENGMELLAAGSIKVFAQRGRYQLYVNQLQPMGRGALELAFQQLQAKLLSEGLFATETKKELPKYPVQIAIVTSRQTAALQDILKVTGRFKWIRTTLFHVPVQGENCGPQIADMIERVNVQKKFEVILLSRGGGSLEDRWGFNHERVARAIAASIIPVVTGIGHEVDSSIADLVADYHAHTPTEAAQVITSFWRNVSDLLTTMSLRMNRFMQASLQESKFRLSAIEQNDFFRKPTDRIFDLVMLVDDRQRSLRLEIFDFIRSRGAKIQSLSDRLQRQAPAARLQRSAERLQQTQRRLVASLNNKVRACYNRLEQKATALAEHHPRNRIALLSLNLSAAETRLKRAMQTNLTQQVVRLSALFSELQALSPQRVLERGYTVTRIKKSGVIVRNALDLKERVHIITRFHDGEVESSVEDAQQPKLFE